MEGGNCKALEEKGKWFPLISPSSTNHQWVSSVIHQLMHQQAQVGKGDMLPCFGQYQVEVALSRCYPLLSLIYTPCFILPYSVHPTDLLRLMGLLLSATMHRPPWHLQEWSGSTWFSGPALVTLFILFLELLLPIVAVIHWIGQLGC